MSYFIANLIQYNTEEDRIYVRGGTNNVVPRLNNFTHYPRKRYLLIDLISGSLDLRCSNKLAKKCKDSLRYIKLMHKNQFGTRQETFQNGEWQSINPYSLYMISRYSQWNKKETLKNTFDLTHISEDREEQKLEEARAIQEIWDEAIEFYIKVEKYFYDYIGIPLSNPQPEKQLKLKLTP